MRRRRPPSDCLVCVVQLEASKPNQRWPIREIVPSALAAAIALAPTHQSAAVAAGVGDCNPDAAWPAARQDYADLVKKGFVSPLGEDTQKWLAENYAAGDSWVASNTVP